MKSMLENVERQGNTRTSLIFGMIFKSMIQDTKEVEEYLYIVYESL